MEIRFTENKYGAVIFLADKGRKESQIKAGLGSAEIKSKVLAHFPTCTTPAGTN